ncbi:MAG: hypothetical protein ACLQIB_25700 [Isosphaeraceae bacterium]
MTEQSPAEAIFVAALEKVTAEERIAYLDAACGDDISLRRRVERLLAAHPQVGSFLQSPAQVEVGAAEAATVPPGEQSPAVSSLAEGESYHSAGEGEGSIIAGRYKLLETLGQGGMGAVFMARQTAPVKRLVALKLIKLGMDSRQIFDPLRGRAAGAGPDGSSQYRQGPGRRSDRLGSAFLCDGAREGRADHSLL